MKLEIHILAHDHEDKLPWAVGHYLSLGAKVIVHDGGPSFTLEVMGAETRKWDTGGQLNDELAMNLKNECWKGTEADWLAVMDCDELLYFPKGVEETLSTYSRLGAAVIKPHGYEMFSDEMPNITRPLIEQVKHGAPDNKWYGKPVLFSPKKVAESGFGMGAHESRPILHSGRELYVGSGWPQANPPTYLLHYHQIGPIEYVARRYDETRTRLAAINEKHGWGNFKKGLEHAQEKRDYILPLLRQVVG